MKVNGWELYQHRLFQSQLSKIFEQSEKLKKRSPEEFHEHPTAKLGIRLTKLIYEEIPINPAHENYKLGNSLGSSYRHWKRAKFGRYRLFFRYHATKKIIVYAWVNDENNLRKSGDKNDPYRLFSKGLENGKPPDSLTDLLEQSTTLK